MNILYSGSSLGGRPLLEPIESSKVANTKQKFQPQPSPSQNAPSLPKTQATAAFNSEANLLVIQLQQGGKNPLQIPSQNVVDAYTRIRAELSSQRS